MSAYVVNTPLEQKEMLQEIGLESLDDLYVSVPEEALAEKLNVPSGKSELEVYEEMKALAQKNQVFREIYRGAGAYHHYIPSIVSSITSKEEFVTSYTPYQAEISQGVLQSIFEYQTQMCELTGLDVSNASVYDGAVAAAQEATQAGSALHAPAPHISSAAPGAVPGERLGENVDISV